MVTRWQVFWFALGAITLVSCAGFSYRFYGLDATSYEGKLLGPDEKDDLALSVCAPEAQERGKCVVLLRDEFFRFKQDYETSVQRVKDLEAQLRECQAGSLKTLDGTPR